MKILSKKIIAGMIAGTFIIAGAVTPFIVQASEKQQSPIGAHQKPQKDHKVNPEEAAKHLSTIFGINQATILKYNADGMNFKDIGKAAFIANAGSKNLEDVISHKTPDNKWKDVATTMGISKEQMHAAKQNMMATRLSEQIGLDKKTSLNLLNQGYKGRDIFAANQLAANTNKSLTEILALKTSDNTWSDVASSLGVDKKILKHDGKKMKKSHHFFNKDNKDQRDHKNQNGDSINE